MRESGELQNYKDQERLKQMKSHAWNTGDMDTVAKIAKRIDPEDPVDAAKKKLQGRS